MKQKILFIVLVIFSFVCQANAQVQEVAGWSVELFGSDKYNLKKVESNNLLTLFFQDGRLMMLFYNIDNKECVFTAEIHEIYLCQEIAKNKNFVGVKGKITWTFRDKPSSIGYFNLDLSRTGEECDVLTIDVPVEKTAIAGMLLKDEMRESLFPLIVAGTNSKFGKEEGMRRLEILTTN